jgi:hypothetical protein
MRLDSRKNHNHVGDYMTEIKISTPCTISVWRKNGPSIMTSASPEEPFKMEFDSNDVVRIVIT